MAKGSHRMGLALHRSLSMGRRRAALNEAECNAEGNWFCDPEFAAVVGGIVYFELFLIGLVAIGIAWILHALLRRRDARRR
jgi:hypothetical protein